MRVALGVSGRIGSGKSTLARSLANRLGCPLASFGEYVRSVAKERGQNPTDRAVLQELGEELIGRGWHEFCLAVLKMCDYREGSVVVDGVRHKGAVTALADIVKPVPWRLAAVVLDEERRRERLGGLGADPSAVVRADSHRNEVEVGLVMELADYRVSGLLPVEEAATEVLRELTADLGSQPA